MKKVDPIALKTSKLTKDNKVWRYSCEAQAQYCKQWKQSQLSKAAFCKKEGISLSALYRWLSAEKNARGQGQMQLLPLDPTQKAPYSPGADVELSIFFPNGTLIKLPWTPDPKLLEWLKGLLS